MAGHSQGWGPLRRDWYSICSTHQTSNERCSRCAVGTWKNAWAAAIGRRVYTAFPGLWRWWANRRRH